MTWLIIDPATFQLIGMVLPPAFTDVTGADMTRSKEIDNDRSNNFFHIIILLSSFSDSL